MSAAAPRDGALDGLRGLAAAGVLVLHVWMFDRGDAGGSTKSLLDHALGELRLGVPLFFVLSGFLLYRPVAAACLSGTRGPSWGAYAIRRAARILPAYWFALAGAFLVTTLEDHRGAVGVGQLWIFLVFGQNQSEATMKHLDPPMWTLGVEVSFYALLPVAGLVAQRLAARRRAQLLVPGGLVAAAVALTTVNALHPWPRTVSTSLLLHVGEFACGMVAAVLVHGRRPARRVRWVLLGTGTLLILLDGIWHSYGMGSQTLRSALADLPAAAGFAMLVAALVTGPPTRGRPGVLASRPLGWLGDLSYALYLWHFVVIVALRARGWWPEHLVPAVALTLAVTSAVAAVSWVALERPAIRRAACLTGRGQRIHPRAVHAGAGVA